MAKYEVLYKSKYRKRFTTYGFKKVRKEENAKKQIKKELKKYPSLKGKGWKFKVVKR